MAFIYENTYFDGGIRPLQEANLSIAGSAVLYGLSVYTVFPVHIDGEGRVLAFRLADHYRRLVNSAHIIGMDTFAPAWPQKRFLEAVSQLIKSNSIADDVFVRATVHINELVPGTRSRGLKTLLSMFVYKAEPILPAYGVRLKTSVWRRIPDYAIPSRAKVNGAYINSVLAKQDALDSGYDDCIFLDTNGHVCELSAANIFMVRGGELVTPDTTSDLLEGINRQTVLDLAIDMKLPAVQRDIDLTELYIADEVFVCGTSAYIASVAEIDARTIGDGQPGPITKKIRGRYWKIMRGQDKKYKNLVTAIT